MKSNYLEELKVIFQRHQIPLTAQEEVCNLFRAAEVKSQPQSWKVNKSTDYH